MITYNTIQYKCADKKTLFLINTYSCMWKSTSSGPSLRTTLRWVLHPDSWAKRLWYTLTGSGRSNTKRKRKILSQLSGQVWNQPLHWATTATRTSIRCLKNHHKYPRVTSLKKSKEHQMSATQKLEPAILNESSNIIWRRRSAEIHVEVTRRNLKFKTSVSTSQRTHTTVISTKTDAILGNKRRLLRHTKIYTLYTYKNYEDLK